MAYVKPDAVVENLIQAGINKAKLGVKDLLIRGILSGALLGCATTLAFTATAQTGLGIAGALIFPVGFVMIVLLGLELVTGNFAVVPLGVMDGKVKMADLLSNWTWVFAGNLIGGMLIDGVPEQKPVGKKRQAIAQSNMVFLLRTHATTREGRALTAGAGLHLHDAC